MTTFKTEFPFTLRFGYADESGELHKEGTMRLATAADELLPMRDPRVQQNPNYLPIIVLSRVITRLGSISMITPKVVEGLFASDFSMLQDMYVRVNQQGSDTVSTRCPKCDHSFDTEVQALGEA